MSPWQSPSQGLVRRPGFTLVELLVVVLIIGILAAIALPRFLGQRTRTKNAAAQAAARHALLAARSYYTQNGESYVGLGPTQLQGYESSLGTTEPADNQTPGDSANPQNIWIGNGLTSTNPDLVANGDPNGGSTVVLCSVSKGDTVYCVKDTNGVASYLQVQGASTSVSAAAGGSFTASGWSSGSASAVPTLARNTVGAKLHEDFSDGDFTSNPTWYGLYPSTSTWTVSAGVASLGTNVTTWGRTDVNIENSDYLTLKTNKYSVTGLGLRVYFDNAAAGNNYDFENSYAGAGIYKTVSGTTTTLGTGATPVDKTGATQWFAFKWSGSTLTAWQDGVQVASASDSASSFSNFSSLFFFRSAGDATDYFRLDDLSLMNSWNVVVSGLPTGYQARVRNSSGTAIITASEASGTATLDLSGKAAFPYADVQVLDGSGSVKATLAPTATVSGHSVAGVFGGDVYTYSS